MNKTIKILVLMVFSIPFFSLSSVQQSSQKYTFTFSKQGGFDGTHFDYKLYINVNGLYVLRRDIKDVPGEWATFKTTFYSNQFYYKVDIEKGWHVRGEKLTGEQAYNYLVENVPTDPDTSSYLYSQKAGANPKIVNSKQTTGQTLVASSTGGTSSGSAQQAPAGSAGPGQVDSVGSGQAISAGPGQVDSVGSGQAISAGSGQADSVGSGQTAGSKQTEGLSSSGTTDSNQIDWVEINQRVLQKGGHKTMTVDELEELRELAREHNRHRFADKLNSIIISRLEKIKKEQEKQEEQQQNQKQEEARQSRAQDPNLAWQNLTASEIWAKIKNLSINTWEHMTYDEIKAKAKEARANRQWSLDKQRAVNNAWAQQTRIRHTFDEAKEARDYGKKAYSFYGLATPTISDYAPAFYGNPPHGGLEIKEDDYTPIPIIKNVQVIPAPDGSGGPLVVYNWDNSLKYQPSGKGLRFLNRVFYLNKSGNWVAVFSDGRGMSSSDLPSFVTDETTASGESSWFRIEPKNATGEFSVKFYFQLGGSGPISESEVVFEFDSSGNRSNRSINKR